MAKAESNLAEAGRGPESMGRRLEAMRCGSPGRVHPVRIFQVDEVRYRTTIEVAACLPDGQGPGPNQWEPDQETRVQETPTSVLLVAAWDNSLIHDARQPDCLWLEDESSQGLKVMCEPNRPGDLGLLSGD